MTTVQTSDWYPDPTGRHELRYWDGHQWSDYVADQGVQRTDPLSASEEAAPATQEQEGSPEVGPATGPLPAQARQQVEEFADIAVTVPPAEARDALVAELTSKGFRLTWAGEWHAVAEKGNMTANVLLGGVAQYFKLTVDIFQGTEGVTVIRLVRDPVGYWGGVLGRSRVSSTFKTVVNDIITAFHARGLLSGVEHQG